MRRDLREEAVTVYILLSMGAASSVEAAWSTTLTCAQQLDNLLRVLMGQALHVGDAAGGQWTGQHHDTDSGHAQRRGAGVRGPGKGAGDDADGWHAAGFGRYSVVETPRRAGPSISDPVDDGIALHHQRVDASQRRRGRCS